MSRSTSPDRIPTLATRVRWLDRYRHVLAIVFAVVATRLVIVQLADALDASWSDFQVLLYGGIVGVCIWWGGEVVLAYLTALWETEYDRLSREHGLPRAVLRRQRRRAA